MKIRQPLLLSLLLLPLFAVSALAQGAVLVFPYYTSNETGTADTVLSVTNTNPTRVRLRLFFMEGASCYQADTLEELGANQTVSFRTSYWDPFVTGYLIVVAVNQTGNVVNGITGSAFVRTPPGYFGAGSGAVSGNYVAASFRALNNIAPVDQELALNFGTDLEPMYTSFSTAIQNPTDAPAQTIVVVGMSGSVTYATVTGAGQTGTGQVFDQGGTMRSFSAFLQGSCWARGSLTNLLVPGGLNTFIPTGTTGLLSFGVGGGVGLLITPQNPVGWSGVRLLTPTSTGAVTLTVPSYF